MNRFGLAKKIAFLVILNGFSILQAERWTLASLKFDFKQKENQSQANSQISSVLPQLILEQIAENSLRTIPFQEELDRKLDALQTERLSLFLQLSKENKTRDALVLSNDNPRKLKKLITQAEEKIKEIEKKIGENIKSTFEVQKKYEPKIARENGENFIDENPNERQSSLSFPFPFFRREEEEKEENETIILYKNDSSKLFEPTQKALLQGIESYAFSKEVADSKINGLLTGEITVYGEYLSVFVNLYVFPGARLSASVMEVGNSADLISVAQNLARKLSSSVANSLPVKIRVEIEPEQARKDAVVSVDGVILPAKQDFIVEAGIHSISVSSPGYEVQRITYSFSGEELFVVRSKLKPLTSGNLQLALKKMIPGIFYFRAIETSEISEENPVSSASVNGKPILAIFSDLQQEKAFVYIPENLAFDGASLIVNAEPFERKEKIEKQRKKMYTAYSVLICSLIPTFYTVGNFTAYNNSYSRGRASYDEVIKWQQYSYYCSGVSCAAGAWFVFEMIRYLFVANQVLPATAKIKK
ncbi:hypothetical protein HRO26_01430 [Treponema pectinovorum]|uniref:hypothetical protein n=1 Tax=Treponema pectinovorum TaxID=164 RepID=UPI003D8A4020